MTAPRPSFRSLDRAESEALKAASSAAYLAVLKPIEPIAIKIDWQQMKNAARTGVNQWNVGLGYLF